MSNCCTQYHFHKGTPVGSVGKIADREAYVTGDSQDDASVRAVVLLVADVFGYSLNNSRVLADTFAKGIGAKVYVPDFFDGEDLIKQNPPDLSKFDFGSFLAKHHPREKAWAKVEPVIKAIRTKHPNAKVGAVGYCWGAPSCLWLGSSDRSAETSADAIAFAHGSLVDVKDFDKLSKPGLSITPEHDERFTEEIRLGAIETTKKLATEKDVFTKWVWYPRVKHGFAARGDEQDAFTARAMGDAATEVINFFKAELL